MDKAPDFGSGDCRFESCHARKKLLFCLLSSVLHFDRHLIDLIFLSDDFHSLVPTLNRLSLVHKKRVKANSLAMAPLIGSDLKLECLCQFRHRSADFSRQKYPSLMELPLLYTPKVKKYKALNSGA